MAVKTVVAALQVCADALLKVDASVVVDVEAKASIVACIVAILTLLVQVLLQVSLKFGVAVVATTSAQIDVVARLCLVNLNICIDGILVLIVNALASVTIGLFVQVNLKLCLSVLGL